MQYNLINGPKTTVIDYLKKLDIEELLEIYQSSFDYKVLLPGLKKKVEVELERRRFAMMEAA